MEKNVYHSFGSHNSVLISALAPWISSDLWVPSQKGRCSSSSQLYSFNIRQLYSVFYFMRTKVFVHSTHLILPQISQRYLINLYMVRTFDKNAPRILWKLIFKWVKLTNTFVRIKKNTLYIDQSLDVSTVA